MAAVIKNSVQPAGKAGQRQQLITYYTGNRERMKYKEYRQMDGGIIGLEAIESAHRTVEQCCMKQAGQRWSIQNAPHTLDLRVTRMNGKWAKVIEIAKKYGSKAATAA